MTDSRLWKALEKVNGALPLPMTAGCGDGLLLPVPGLSSGAAQSYWMVAEYKKLKDFAKTLRISATHQKFVTDHAVRFGLRDADIPPKSKARQKDYGATTPGANVTTNFATNAQRGFSTHQPVQTGLPDATNRRGDREGNFLTYWATQTAQSHHIVEYNHLHAIGKSELDGKGELDHARLPCVLLAAEFHQLYISSILKKTHGSGQDFLLKNLGGIYRDIYGSARCPPLKPLWPVSEVILRAAGVPV